MELILEGKSPEGERYIAENGENWTVLTYHKVSGMLISPTHHIGRKDGKLRWINTNDVDLRIVKVINPDPKITRSLNGSLVHE